MKKILFTLFLVLITIILAAQVRNGWRSVYDVEGRLTRMYYYNNGMIVHDSSYFYQYYTDNYLKAIVSGEIKRQNGGVNGTVCLFDEMGKLTRYTYGMDGSVLFNVECDYYEECIASWGDDFEVVNNCWLSDSFNVQNGHLMVYSHNNTMNVAVYDPEIPVDLEHDFVCKVEIPKNNTSKQGLALGWDDNNNYYLIELTAGAYYNVYNVVDGKMTPVTQGRVALDKPGTVENTLLVRKNSENIIVEWNNVIQGVYKTPEFKGNKLALVSRSIGDMRIDDFVFSYKPNSSDFFMQSLWIGKGTGFFIAPDRILTTYDNIAEAKNLRVLASIDGERYTLPVSIFRVEEEHNMAVLKVDDRDFKAFDQLPFGYTDKPSLTDTKILALGFPNALGGVYMHPEIFQGKVMFGSTRVSGCRMLEIPFRFGMVGAPVFDSDANLLGVMAYKGTSLKCVEMLDFSSNARLFMANMGKFEKRIVSPIKDLSNRDKTQKLSDLVVIIESSVFDLDK